MSNKINVLDLSYEELTEFFASIGEKKYRSEQILNWIGKGVRDIDKMTDMSADLRETLKKRIIIGNLTAVKKLISQNDGTVKYLFELPDKEMIESVLMNYSYGYSVCVSS